MLPASVATTVFTTARTYSKIRGHLSQQQCYRHVPHASKRPAMRIPSAFPASLCIWHATQKLWPQSKTSVSYPLLPTKSKSSSSVGVTYLKIPQQNAAFCAANFNYNAYQSGLCRTRQLQRSPDQFHKHALQHAHGFSINSITFLPDSYILTLNRHSDTREHVCTTVCFQKETLAISD
jgi:hypothetical protein